MTEALTLGALVTLVSLIGMFTKISWDISKNIATLVNEQANAKFRISENASRLDKHGDILSEHSKKLTAHEILLEHIKS